MRKDANGASPSKPSKLRALLANPTFTIGLLMLVVIIAAALLADVIAPHGYADQNLAAPAPSTRGAPTSTVAASSAAFCTAVASPCASASSPS